MVIHLASVELHNSGEKDICYICSDPNDEGGQLIGCDLCGSWLHQTCLKVTAEEFEKLQAKNKWFCSRCKESPFAYTNCTFTPAVDNARAVWGQLKGKDIQQGFDKAYKEIVTWKKNIFKVPTGKIGQQFIREISKIANEFAASTPLENSAMTMIMVIGPLLLQKPAQGSKTKDHVKYLEKRLKWWREGNLSELLKEGRAIQKRMHKSKKKEPDSMKIFTRLMLQGKVSAALRWLNDERGSMKETSPEVINLLKQKHPEGNLSVEIDKDNTLEGPIYAIDNVIFENIDSDSIATAAKHTKGAAGPSGIDADTWRHILCSKSFRAASTELCDSLALIARKMATVKLDPAILTSYTNGRLIPLDKPDGEVRPIGIGEILRRIIGKAITNVVKPELLEATAPLQTCGGLQGGIEAAIHAMSGLFEEENTHGILLVDAENAFNSLNRKVALHNAQIICPEFATYLINTYRCPAKLFIPDDNGVYILSEEGTTQGDNTAMGFYAIGIMPLLHNAKKDTLNENKEVNVSHIWYADDAGAGGTLSKLATWWKNMKEYGPSFGYFPKPSKSWLIVKEEFVEEARRLFPDVKITTEGHEYLGFFIGTEKFKETFLNNKVEEWTNEINTLAKAAAQEPQLVYAAFMYGTSKKWNFLMRTTPDIAHKLEKVEEAIASNLLPKLIGRNPSREYRALFSLPTRLGGLAIPNPVDSADREYHNSIRVTESLVNEIRDQKLKMSVNWEATKQIKRDIGNENDTEMQQRRDTILHGMVKTKAQPVILACEKGASSWLTCLPLEDCGFVLNKQEFQDAIALRYNFPIKGIAKHCSCGEKNSIDHCLMCKKGGFVIMRHNSLRDTLAEMMEKVCSDVVIEPKLLPLDGEVFQLRTANTAEEARLDISARNFWQPLGRSFFDVRVLHPGSPTNANKGLAQMYKEHENEKKRAYNNRVIEVEKATFTPLVFSTSGGMGQEAATFIKKLSGRLAEKTNQEYNSCTSFIRRRLRFDLLKTSLISLRGHRGRFYEKPGEIANIDMHLV